MKIGLERLSEPTAQRLLKNRHIGLLVNQASVDRHLCFAASVVDQLFPGQLKCLFSPQHGIWGEQQANMLETAHDQFGSLGLPVFSLYSETRRPTDPMLERIDCVVVDLQDVGTRVYTFIWTMLEVMRACAEANKAMVVLDRPNPIGGTDFEGAPLDAGYLSFVGGASIPMRHGLTMAELALMLKSELQLKLDLQVVPMEGWHRCDYFPSTGRNWIWPSPNMPSPTTTLLYPGQVLLEGTNLSEGRGTTRPFELVGAPFVNAKRWLTELAEFPLHGVQLLATRFQPTFDKWKGKSCQGIDIQIIQAAQVRSFELTVALIATAAKLFPEFAWLAPPYEYEFQKPPIDILFGNHRLRESIGAFRDAKINLNQLLANLQWDEDAWRKRIQPHLLYPAR